MPIIAMGGIGGSGTRAFAQIMRNAGYHLGCDLNAALDNLMFSLIFKRPSALMWNHETFKFHLLTFLSHLQTGDLPEDFDEIYYNIPASGRAGHSAEWLFERLARAQHSPPISRGRLLAWKEPNTHIFIEKILEISNNIKYVHIVRDHRYMVSSNNVNQLLNWGSVFFDESLPVSANNILRYWVAVQERMIGIYNRFPDRVMFMSYDRLMTTSQVQIEALLRFCETPAIDDPLELAASLEFVPRRAPLPDVMLDARQSRVLAETLAICA